MIHIDGCLLVIPLQLKSLVHGTIHSVPINLWNLKYDIEILLAY